MNNFVIVPDGDEFCVKPVSEMAKSLKAHCKYKGANFIYPTHDGAKSAVSRMDQAIENRQGRPWQVFKVMEVIN